jgi:hypothetical protein
LRARVIDGVGKSIKRKFAVTLPMGRETEI